MKYGEFALEIIAISLSGTYGLQLHTRALSRRATKSEFGRTTRHCMKHRSSRSLPLCRIRRSANSRRGKIYLDDDKYISATAETCMEMAAEEEPGGMRSANIASAAKLTYDTNIEFRKKY